MNNQKLEKRINTFLSPESRTYLAITLVVSILSCIGTWVVPLVSPLPVTINDPNIQDPTLYVIVSIGWVALIVIGSVSLWTFAIISIRIVGSIFEFNDWRDLFPNHQFSRLLAITTFLYLLMAVYISTFRFSPLVSAIVVIGSQAAGMILVGGLATLTVYISYSMYSSVITENLKKLSIEQPEVISSLGTKDEITSAIIELRESYIKIGLKSLLVGLVVGAALGGYLSIFRP